MPALFWCGRRWLAAADDFVFSGIITAIVHFSLVAAYSVAYFKGFFDVSEGDPDGSRYAKFTRQGTTVALIEITFHLIAGVFFSRLACMSGRGGVFEIEKRKRVPCMLYFITAIIFFQAWLTGVLFYVFHASRNYEEVIDSQFNISTQNSTEQILHETYVNEQLDRVGSHRTHILIAAVIELIMFFAVVLSSMCSVNINGKSEFKHGQHQQNREHQVDNYERIMRFLCCCVGSRSERKQSGSDMFKQVAESLHIVFGDEDLVPSDIMAGLMMLSRVQRQKVLKDDGKEDLNQSFLRIPLDYRIPEQGATSAVPGLLSRTTTRETLAAERRQNLDDAMYFAKYFVAAYGWKLFVFEHPLSGIPRLCGSCGHINYSRIDSHGVGSCCSDRCNFSSMHQCAPDLNENNILFTSFHSDIYLPGFFVCRDWGRNQVVISIRGTMSVTDAIIDASAGTHKLPPIPGMSAPAYAHRGMYRSAVKILKLLKKHGIIRSLFSHGQETSKARVSPDSGSESSNQTSPSSRVHDAAPARWMLHDHDVTILGHSLGAGVATILAILLRLEYPTLAARLKCFAYAPPGGLLSRELAQYTKPFVFAVFVGNDLVPRMAEHTLVGLREEMVHVLKESRDNKAKVFTRQIFKSILRVIVGGRRRQIYLKEKKEHRKLVKQNVSAEDLDRDRKEKTLRLHYNSHQQPHQRGAGAMAHSDGDIHIHQRHNNKNGGPPSPPSRRAWTPDGRPPRQEMKTLPRPSPPEPLLTNNNPYLNVPVDAGGRSESATATTPTAATTTTTQNNNRNDTQNTAIVSIDHPGPLDRASTAPSHHVHPPLLDSEEKRNNNNTSTSSSRGRPRRLSQTLNPSAAAAAAAMSTEQVMAGGSSTYQQGALDEQFNNSNTGGGRNHHDQNDGDDDAGISRLVPRTSSAESEGALSPALSMYTSMERTLLFPPSNLCRLSEGTVREQETRGEDGEAEFFGPSCCEGNKTFRPHFIDEKGVQRIVSSASMFLDHLPYRLYKALHQLDLDREPEE